MECLRFLDQEVNVILEELKAEALSGTTYPPQASRNTHLSSYGRMDAIYDPNPEETVRIK
jgi:hypothetical protein